MSHRGRTVDCDWRFRAFRRSGIRRPFSPAAAPFHPITRGKSNAIRTCVVRISVEEPGTREPASQ